MDQRDKTIVVQLIPHICEAGAETLVKDYAVNLNKDKFVVYVLTVQETLYNSSNLQEILNAGVNVICPYKWGSASYVAKIIRHLKYLFNSRNKEEVKRMEFVKQNIIKIRPDVIHVHMQMLKYLFPISNFLEGTKLFYTCHSLPKRYFNDKKEIKELEAADFLIKHNGLRLIALHEAMRKELNQLFSVNNTIILRNCVDFKKFQNISENKESIRASLNIPKDSFVIGHIGRFIYIKNHKYIVEVFREIVKVKQNSLLLLVGEGDTKRNIIKLIRTYKLSDKCIILSPRGDVPRIMKAMDIFIFPSLFEGLPIVAIEAQVAGLRTFISDKVTSDVLFSEQAIALDINANPKIWADAILNKKIEGSKKNNIQDYNMENVMKSVENLYLNN